MSEILWDFCGAATILWCITLFSYWWDNYIVTGMLGMIAFLTSVAALGIEIYIY